MDRLTRKQLRFLRHYGKPQPSERFYFVTVHPLADETELLQRLGLFGGDCKICDFYWAVGDQLAFVSVIAGESEDPGVNYWVKEQDKEVPLRFVVSTRNSPLTRAKISSVVEWLARWVQSHSGQGTQGSPSARISNDDIVAA